MSDLESFDLQVVLKINNRHPIHHLQPCRKGRKKSYETRQMCFSNQQSFFPCPFRCISAFLILCFPLTPVRHPDALMYERYLDRFHNLASPVYL